MRHPFLKPVLALGVSILAIVPALGQMAQEPLLTTSGTAAPNLVLLFDDSASMPGQAIYQYGGSEGVFGRTGPGGSVPSATCPGSPDITTTCTYNNPGATEYYEQSPDVNRLHYDPRVTYRPRVQSDGSYVANATTTATSFKVYFYKVGTVNGVWPGSGNNPTLLSSYFNPSYTPTAAALASGANTSLSYPNSASSSQTQYPKWANRSDCTAATTHCTWTEELQNYANWRKYHSNRLDLAKTGLGEAFKDLGPTIRLGWARINQLDTGNLDSGVGLFSGTRKDDFFDWLYSRQGNGAGTPNRLALDRLGKYYQRQDGKGPWANTPDSSSTGVTTLSTASAGDTAASRLTHASCRRSFGMLMTDGYYNDSAATVQSNTAVGSTNIDDSTQPTLTTTLSVGLLNGVITATTPYTSYTYVPSRPYEDSQNRTLADIAMYYWSRDLRTDLPNNVRPVKAPQTTAANPSAQPNPSFWQNMGFYAVGLGVSGTLPQTIAQFNALKTSTNWPTVATGGNDETTMDDMWHATINARGQLLSAKSADELSNAVKSMLADIAKTNATQSGVAISTANLTAGTRKYTPRYETGSWTGNVIARNLDLNTGNEISTAWQVVGTDTSVTPNKTYNGIPAYGTRNIMTWNGSAGIAFANTAAITSQMTATTDPVLTVNANMINYLKGDQTNEGESGLATYRKRDSLLGDIVNSTPVFIKSGLDMGYQDLPSSVPERANYTAFVTQKAARAEGVVFVGANDGMLHGFRNGSTAINGGHEVFAYIPRAVLPNLPLLASPNYQHRYYVDGPLVESDAYFGTHPSGSWKNLIVGTTGAGAKAVFALDVTDPINMDASSVLWEIGTGTTGYTQLGHILSDVQTGRARNGDWVAVFGNGYDSTGGTARLYVANLRTGALIRDIPVDTTGSNGLGAVTVVRDANKQIIGAYAGDLKGRMWKFDLSSANAANWAVGLNGSPLFNAGTTKPITVRPSVIPEPTTGGNVIAFGTGKLFTTTDLSTTNQQTAYGILDTIPFGTPTTPMTTVTAANLIQQTVTQTLAVTRTVTSAIDLAQTTQTFSYFTVSRNTVTFSATTRGWYLDLPNSGQRVIYPLETLVGRFVGLDTVSPVGVSLDPCAQGSSGSGWLYFIDGLTGGGPSEAILDTNGDGQIDAHDTLANGITTLADGRNLTAVVQTRSSTTQTTLTNISGGSGGSNLVRLTCQLLNNCPNNNTSPTRIKSREWRQLFMR